MSQKFRVFIYVIGSILITFLLFFSFISIKASYGGLKLNFLENHISKEIESRLSLNTKSENIILRRNSDDGFYFEINKFIVSDNNNTLLESDLIRWDFRIINLLTLSLDRNSKIYIQNTSISTSEIQMTFEEVKTNFNELEEINIFIKKLNFKNVTSSLNFILIDSRLDFSTNSLLNLLNTNIQFISTLSINNEKFETEVEYTSSNKQINILKFQGNDFYISDNSVIELDENHNNINIKLDINAKKNSIIKTLNLSHKNNAFPFINSFRGWQSILLESSFRYNNTKFYKEIIDNLNLKISGIYQLKSLLPEDKFYSNFGNITNYEIDFYNEKDNYVVNVQNIKNDLISFKKGSFFKLNKEFTNANINLVTSIERYAAINFLKTTILSRESNTGKVVDFLEKNLNKENDVVLNFNINPLSANIVNSLSNLYVIASGEINSDFVFDDNENPNFISGPINYYLEIKDFETSTPKLTGLIDFTKVKAFIRQINLNKNDSTNFKIQFEGDTNSLNDSLIKFDSLDSEIDFKGKIKITKTNHIFLEKLLINNNSNVNLNLSGDLSKRILNLEIEGNVIDLSKNKVETKKTERTYYLKKENYSINTENVIFAGSVKVDDFKAKIEKEGSKLSVNSRAQFNGHELNYSREKSDDIDVNIIKSTDITHFVNKDHPARKLLSDGEIKMTSIRNLNSQEAKVKIELNDFVLINTPASLKLLSLPSISGLVSIAEGEQGIRFGYGEINYIESENKFSEIEAFAVSDSLGLIMEGGINRKEELIDMKGEISPMHLVNAIIQKLPILGPLIVGGEGEGMFSIDFKMTGSSEDPDVDSNPLTIIKPRIIERAIEAIDNGLAIQ